MTTIDERRKWFLAKAKEAEENAATTADQTLKAEWLKIADGYRKMVEGVTYPKGV